MQTSTNSRPHAAACDLFEHLEPRRLLASSIAFEHLLESIDGALDPIASFDVSVLPTESAGFGSSLAVVGDLDSDGVNDFAIGSVGAPSTALEFAVGGVHVFSGRTRERIFSVTDGLFEFGAALAAPGDINGDDVPDLVVGSPRAFVLTNAPQEALQQSLIVPGPGRVYVYSGNDGSLLHEFDGTTNFGEFGRSLAVLRDLNDDGVPELAIGAPGAGPASEGHVSIVDLVTGQTLTTLTGEATLDRFGAAVSISHAPGSALIVGAPGNDETAANAGKAYVYDIDPMGQATVERTLLPDGASLSTAIGNDTNFGASVASFRRDASDNLAVITAIGAPGYDSPFANAGSRQQVGRVYTFTSNDSRITPRDMVGNRRDQRLGTSLTVLPALSPDSDEWLVVTSADGASPRFLTDDGFALDTLPDSLGNRTTNAVDHARERHMLPTAVAPLADLDGDGTIDLVSTDVRRGTVNVIPGRLVEALTPILGASGDGTYIWTEHVVIHDGIITPIDVYTGIDNLEIISINNLGEVLGIRHIGNDESIIIVGDDTHEDIPPDDAIDGLVPRRIVDAGVVVFTLPEGAFGSGDGPLVVFHAGTFTDLGIASFTDINDSGTLLAHRDTGDALLSETITWTPGDADPTVVPGLFRGEAINNSGVIIGRTSRWVIATWDDGRITPYGTPNTASPETPFSSFTLHDLNDQGEFVATFSIRLVRASPRPVTAFGLPARMSLLSEVGSKASTTESATQIFNDGRMLTSNGFLRGVNPDEHISIAPGPSVSGTSGGGRVVLTGTNEFGDAVVFRLDTDARRADFDLPADSAFPDDTNYRAGEIVTWVDPVDGRTRIFTNDRIITLESDGRWSERRIRAPFGRTITSDITVMRTPNNTIMLVGLRFDGDLVHYFQSGERDANGDAIWRFANLSNEHFRSQEREPPEFTGNLTAYSTPWNSRHIVGIDANGDLRGVWWSPGLNSPYWAGSNLSDITGVPELDGRLTAFVTNRGQINIAGADADGDLHRVSWQPGSSWHHENLTQLTTPTEPPFLAPVRIEPDSLTGYVTPWGGVNFFGIDRTSSTPVSFFLPRGETQWNVLDFDETLIDPVPIVEGALIGATGPGLGHNVFATTPDGEVMLFRWRAGDTSWSVVPIRDLLA